MSETKTKDSGVYVITMWAILIVGFFLATNVNQVHRNISYNTAVLQEQNKILFNLPQQLILADINVKALRGERCEEIISPPKQ